MDIPPLQELLDNHLILVIIHHIVSQVAPCNIICFIHDGTIGDRSYSLCCDSLDLLNDFGLLDNNCLFDDSFPCLANRKVHKCRQKCWFAAPRAHHSVRKVGGDWREISGHL